jgi:hypothetical protein
MVIKYILRSKNFSESSFTDINKAYEYVSFREQNGEICQLVAVTRNDENVIYQTT